jgi:DNA repair protein RadC
MKPLTQVAEIQISYQPSVSNKPVIKCSYDAYEILKEFFPKQKIALQEMFVVAYLNRCGRVIGVYELSTGGITGTVADVRLILGTALKAAATSIILAHNHPSGNLTPSTADTSLTAKIKEASKYFDINLSDHIILSPTEGSYYSFADEGNI